jgi:hypothetical protein
MMKMTLEIDLDNKESIMQARALLDFHLNQINQQDNSDVKSANKSANVESDTSDLEKLKKFSKGLSEKQQKVWDYFLKNPGNALGSDLKAAVPDLQPQGALAGVFKATQRWVTMGGLRELSPFVQVTWSKAHGCGVYRGLTQEEIDFLTH